MKRDKLVVVAAVLLMLSPVVVYAASSGLEHIRSNESTGFDRISSQNHTQLVSGGFELNQTTKSRSSFFGSQLKSTYGDLDVNNDRIKVGTSYNRLDQITSSSESLETDWSEEGDGAYYQGTHYFLDSWATSTDQGWNLFRWDENGLTKLYSSSGRVASGLSYWKDDKLAIFVSNAGSGSYDKIITYDISSDSVTTTRPLQSTWSNHVQGAAHYSTGWISLIFANGQVKTYEVKSDGSVNKKVYHGDFSVSSPTGLALNEQTDRYYSFDQADSKLKVIDPDSETVIDSKSYANQYWGVGAVDHGANENFNNGKFTVLNQRKGLVYELATEDLTHDYTHKWTSKEFSLAPEYESISNVDVSFSAPQLWGSYKVELQKKEANESSWTTIGSQSIHGGQTTFSGNSFEVNSSGVKFRLRMVPGKHHGLSGNVKITRFDLDYTYYRSTGQVLGHAENDTDLGIDVAHASDIEYLNFTGTSPTNGQVDLSVVNKEGETVYSSNSVIGSNLNVSGGVINESKYANQRLFLKFDYRSKGLTTPRLTGLDLAYQPEPPAPEITDWYAEVGSRKLTDTSVQTGVGANNTFVIKHVNQSVDYIDWYVDGEVVKHQKVSSDGPFYFNKSWSEEGKHTVRGEVYSIDSGSDSVKWDVRVYKILIAGENSFTRDPLGVLHFSQFFKVYNVPSAEINVSIQYNESLLLLDNGPTSTTIASGNELQWEFQVRSGVEDYSGTPITIIATYDNKTTTKQIHLSVAESGGVLASPSSDGILSVYLANPVTDSLLRLSISPLFIVGIWLQYFGLIPRIPRWVQKELNRIQSSERFILSLVIGSWLLPGYLFPALLTGVGAVVWWQYTPEGSK